MVPGSLSSTQPTDTMVDLDLDIKNFGGADLDWNIYEDGDGAPVCDVASDIAWASVAPDMGTTAPAGTETVVVTLDSTGLASGTYDGTLCVESNDPVTPLVEVPVTLTVEAPVADDLVCNSGVIAFESGLPASWRAPFARVWRKPTSQSWRRCCEAKP